MARLRPVPKLAWQSPSPGATEKVAILEFDGQSSVEVKVDLETRPPDPSVECRVFKELGHRCLGVRVGSPGLKASQITLLSNDGLRSPLDGPWLPAEDDGWRSTVVDLQHEVASQVVRLTPQRVCLRPDHRSSRVALINSSLSPIKIGGWRNPGGYRLVGVDGQPLGPAVLEPGAKLEFEVSTNPGNAPESEVVAVGADGKDLAKLPVRHLSLTRCVQAANYVLAIDFGTSGTSVVFRDVANGKSEFIGPPRFPTRLYCPPGHRGRWAIGKEAFEQDPRQLQTETNLKHFIRTNADSQDAREKVTFYFNKLLTSLIAPYVEGRSITGHAIDVVLTVPVLGGVGSAERMAYEQAIVACVEHAGLDENWRVGGSILLVEEPLAGAFSLLLGPAQRDARRGLGEGDWVMVLDCGAGTSDISLGQLGMDDQHRLCILPDTAKYDNFNCGKAQAAGNLITYVVGEEAHLRATNGRESSQDPFLAAGVEASGLSDIRQIVTVARNRKVTDGLKEADFIGQRWRPAGHEWWDLFPALFSDIDEAKIEANRGQDVHGIRGKNGASVLPADVLEACSLVFDDLPEKMVEVTENAGIRLSEVKRVFLVGGSSKLIGLQQAMSNIVPGRVAHPQDEDRDRHLALIASGGALVHDAVQKKGLGTRVRLDGAEEAAEWTTGQLASAVDKAFPAVKPLGPFKQRYLVEVLEAGEWVIFDEHLIEDTFDETVTISTKAKVGSGYVRIESQIGDRTMTTEHHL